MASQPPLPSPPPLADLVASGPLALFLDFDGTLVEIAPDPDAIVVPPTLARRLAVLNDQLDGRLALVSGRALDDLTRHLGPIGMARAGSHGAHCVRADGSLAGAPPEPLPGEIVARMRAFAQECGLRYEAKSHGGALHYRARPEMADAVHALADELAASNGLCVKRDKAVAELVRPGASKRGAVQTFMAENPFSGSTAIFVGDDVTDEDGFAGAIEFGGFGLAVGDRMSDKARYRLDTVSAVHEWLNL